MSLRQKKPRVKLGSGAYSLLRNQVLERDNWRCQDCGSFQNLQVHHLKFRSSFGDDLMANLITLCAACHKIRHGRLAKIKVVSPK
jgi:5-methylcytosine-specific restriction endonuclease McrA